MFFEKRPYIKPKKNLGQNFLIDQKVVQKIIDAVDPLPADVIVELGAGKGILTDYLVPRSQKTIAVELDQRLSRILMSSFGTKDNFCLKEMDILDVSFADFSREFNVPKMKLVGNLPYNITSPILFKLIDEREYLHNPIVMMQLEVAQRLAAKPGTKSYGVPTIITQLYSQPEILFTVPPRAFKPRPKVQSAVVRIAWRDKPAVELEDSELFFRLVRSVFSKRRKMLRNSLLGLTSKEHLPEIEQQSGIELTRRPETLSLVEFDRMARAVWRVTKAG